MAHRAVAGDEELPKAPPVAPLPPPLGSRPSRIARIAGTIGLLAVVLVAVELTCRIEDWVTYGTPVLSRVIGLNDLVVRDADGMHGRPNTQFQKWRMNALGLRGGPATPMPTPGTTRIITVGASETFGLYESPGKEYPAQLADSLRARAAVGKCRIPAERRIEVLNAAFPGMSLPTIAQDIRLRLARYRPNVVLIYPAPAGYLDDQPPRVAAPDSASIQDEWSWTRVMHLRMLDRMRAQIKEVLPDFVKTALRRRESVRAAASHPAGWQFLGVPADRLALYGDDLRQVITAVRGIGAAPVLITHANMFVGRDQVDANQLQAWQKFYPRANGAVIIAFDSAAQDVTRMIGSEQHVLTIDATSRLAGMPVSAFGDFVHFSDAGAGGMAAVISDSLCTSHRLASLPMQTH